MKKLFSSILLIALAFSLVLPSAAADTAEFGMKFSADDRYIVYKAMTAPSTVEFTVEIERGSVDRPGVVIGSFEKSSATCFNVEIYNGGNPRLYMVDKNGTPIDIIFTKADVRCSKPVHVAITWNGADKSASLYIDGKLEETVNRGTLPAEPYRMPTAFKLGGDYREKNDQYFKGKIYGIALWSDVRTPDEIKADMEKITPDDSLTAAWDMSKIPTKTGASTIPNLAGEKHPIEYREEGDWLKHGAYTGDYAYSFAIVGDTQIVTEKTPDKLHTIYDYIIDVADEKNIKFVFGLGDITNGNKIWEWAIAKQVIIKLNGVVPYSIVRGNHDKAPEYKAAFPYSEFKDDIEGSFDGTMLSTYQTFRVGNIKYLSLALDFAYNDEQIAWANKVIEDHPDYNVIISTHIYLHEGGTTKDLGAKKYGADYDPADLWDKIIRKHKNIVMILSGHVPIDRIITSTVTGDHGNKIRQFLIDPQGLDKDEGSTGLVAFFYFSEDGKTVNTDYYSTIKDRYRKGGNLSFTLDVIEPNDPIPETTEAPETTAAPDTDSTATESGCGAVIGGTFVVMSTILGAAWVSKRR